jgi:hypothetical protein
MPDLGKQNNAPIKHVFFSIVFFGCNGFWIDDDIASFSLCGFELNSPGERDCSSINPCAGILRKF